jgi:transcriptional regulator with XRE-family HTH domain
MRQHKKANDLPELCVIVRRIREAYGDSQEQFAQRVDLAPMTVSRFERGKQVPADPQVLVRLRDAARRLLKSIDIACLEEAITKVETRSVQRFSDMRPGLGLAAMPISSLPQWRLMHAAAIAILYYPESVHAIEQAAGPALALVDEAIRQYADQPTAPGLGFHDQLARQLMTLADQRALERFKESK